MKNILKFLSSVIFTANVLAQPSSQKMSYQAIVRNSSNALVQNSPVGIKISILETSITGPAVYVETHTKQTNQNGLLDLQIGGGTVVSGTYTNGINWGISHFLKTEIDPLGGTNYSIKTISELLAVPFSNFANVSNYSLNSNGLNGVAWQFVGSYLGVFEGYSHINYIGSNKISFTYREGAGDNNGNGQIDVGERTFNKTLFGIVTGNVVTFPPQPDGYYIGINEQNTPQITGTLINNTLTLTGVDANGDAFTLVLNKQ